MHPCPQPGTPTSQFHSSVPQLQPLFPPHTVPAPGILLSAASAPSPTERLFQEVDQALAATLQWETKPKKESPWGGAPGRTMRER